ncbi:MAG: RnfABCDGE type electron transport complex subunit D [Actinobacteria bacterium]|nr:RnfABCDGE type electron transport complex subunit D [Actinomycetota bacterium]
MSVEAMRSSSPPHLHDAGETIPRAMVQVLVALMPALAVAVVVFGMNVIYIVTVSVMVAVISELLARALMRRRVTLYDFSAVVTGLLFAFLLPPTTPLWVVAIGAFIAVAVAKELFGGLGKNIFNPALLARVVLMFTPLSIYTSRYVVPFFWRKAGFFTPVTTRVIDRAAGVVAYGTLSGMPLDAVNAATPLSLLHAGKLSDAVAGATPVGATWLTAGGRPTLLSLFLGLKSGSIGEVSILALLLGGVYLMWRRTIDWRIPFGIITAFTLFNMAAGNSPLYQLLSGALFLGAFFMATDWVTSPMSHRGIWIYAVGIGVTVAVLRAVGFHAEAVAVSILYWNLLTTAIDRYLARPRFGESRWRVLNYLPEMPRPPAKPGSKARWE